MFKKFLLFIGSWVLIGNCLAAMPVGSVAIYSDGSVEKLLADEGDRLHWEDHRKRRLVRSKNPIVPLLQRTDFLSKRGYRQTISSGDPGSIKTLAPGEPLEFTVLRTRYNGETSRRMWECQRLARTKEKVIGVSRVLDKYVCERFVLHRKLWNRQFREKREFSYSRDLGLVVELKRQTRTRTSNKRLVAILAPDKAEYRQIKQVLKKVHAGK
jgi:hypothetical protein